MLLKQSFYKQNTLQVAQNLLGCFLVRKIGNKKIKAKITECEAYFGFEDKGSHASRGKTERNKPMFESGGIIYIYLIYGMYNMLNIVTENKDYPSAILIRSVEVLNASKIEQKKYNGPGKLTKNLKIDKFFNNKKIYTKKHGLWIEQGEKIKTENIVCAKRIGIDYAQEYKHKFWRFCLVE